MKYIAGGYADIFTVRINEPGLWRPGAADRNFQKSFGCTVPTIAPTTKPNKTWAAR